MSNDYWKKRQNPLWQRKRLEMLNAADWKCQSCGCANQRLEVHHIAYKKGAEPWEYDALELKVLCVDCHDRIHYEVNPILLNLGAQLDPSVVAELVDRIFLALNTRHLLDRELGKNPKEIVSDIFDSEAAFRSSDLGASNDERRVSL